MSGTGGILPLRGDHWRAELLDAHRRSAMSALRRFETSLKRLKCANSGHSTAMRRTYQIDPKRPVTSNALDSWVRSDHHLAQPVGASMDIGAWLRGLGLGQYEAAFRESEIEADVLPELTEIDLQKIGLPLGPRKRILKAIANLGGAEKGLGEGSLSAPPPAGDALNAVNSR